MDATQEIKMDARESALDMFRRRRIELQEEQMGKIEEKYNKRVEKINKIENPNERARQMGRIEPTALNPHNTPILIEEDEENENKVYISKYQDGSLDEEDYKDRMSKQYIKGAFNHTVSELLRELHSKHSKDQKLNTMKEYSLQLEQPLIREENDKFEKLAQRFRMDKIKQNKRSDDELMMVSRVTENSVVFVMRPACEKCGCTFATKRGVKHHQKTTQKCGIIVDRMANGVPVEAPAVEAPVVEVPAPVVDDEKIITIKRIIKKKKLIIVKTPEIKIEKIEMEKLD